MYELSVRCLLGLLLLATISTAMGEAPEFFEGDTPTRFDNTPNPQLPPRNVSPDAQPSLLIRGFQLVDFLEAPETGVLRSDIDSILAEHISRRDGLFTVAALNELTAELTAYYREGGYILARVIIPEQSTASGTIELRLISGVLHSVAVTGESLYSAETLTVPFLTQIGEPVGRASLEGSLIRLSDYPGIELTTGLAPGPEPGTTQLNLRVLEEKAVAASAELDNYGSADTGRFRFNLAGEYRNPTDHADLLSGSVRASLFSVDSVAAQIDYRLPLPNLTLPGPAVLWQGTELGVGYGLSRFQVTGEFEALNLTGGTNQFYLSGSRKLRNDRRQRLSVDLRLSKLLSEVNQNSATLSSDNLTPLTAGLRWEVTDGFLGGGRTLLSASVTQGLGGFLGGLSGSGDETSSRDGLSGDFAGGVYTVLRGNAERLQTYGGQYILLAGTFQWSNDLLTSAEQIGFGGNATVRGYPESSFSTDSAAIFNLEYYGLSESSGIALPISNIKLAAFWDWGLGIRNDAFANEDAAPSAMSVGAYTSLSVLTTYQARLGLGVPVGSNLPSDGSRFRVLFSLGRTF